MQHLEKRGPGNQTDEADELLHSITTLLHPNDVLSSCKNKLVVTNLQRPKVRFP